MNVQNSNYKDIILRLKKVDGQIGGLIKMLEENKNCDEIIIQFKAVLGAMRKSFLCYLKRNLDLCDLNGKENDYYKKLESILDNLINEEF